MSKADLAAKVRSYLGERRKGTAAFRHAGELLEEIVAVAGVGKPIDCGKSGRFQIADNFARKNTLFKHVGFDRYALESVD